MGERTVSVSKGVFVYKNGGISKGKTNSRNKFKFSYSKLFADTLWYQTWDKAWSSIEKKVETLNNEMFANLTNNLIDSIKNSYNSPVTEIPTATILTGINMPDHTSQFSMLANEIKKSVSPHVAILYPEDCQSLKYMVENTVYRLINKVVEERDSDDDEEEDKKNRTKKSLCNFALLQSWYENYYHSFENRNSSPTRRRMRNEQKLLIVIVPDFENLIEKVIQDFIQIISSYINGLPIVLVFGVATSLTALHKSLPYHVSSKINVQLFHSQPSTLYLNNIVENVLFTDECFFHLGGKVFNLFMDVFLFYDLSVKGFLNNFKFAMLEHFSFGNIMSLCSVTNNLARHISKLTEKDLEDARQLPSFKKYLQQQENKTKLANDDEYFKETLGRMIKSFYMYLNIFHSCLKCLHALVHDLPKAPLGKNLRELYSLATSTNITKTPEFKESFQLLSFQSKDELVAKMNKIVELLEQEVKISKVNNSQVLNKISEQIAEYSEVMEDVTEKEINERPEATPDVPENAISGKMNRKQLKDKLLALSKKSKPMNKYEKIRMEILDFFQNVFKEHLQEPSTMVFHEIFFFNDLGIKKHIMGSQRAAIHTALSDPQHYLQCKCCEIPNEAKILQTMPDVSILYKLHLEYGKWINLHDWLQSFLSIVDPEEDAEDEKRVVNPKLHARFTQAVADLEYLGFIKNSKKKTDHVMRLTWGG